MNFQFATLATYKTSSDGLHLSQQRYLTDVLQRHKMQNAKACPTPMTATTKLTKTDGTPISNGQAYRQILGALQYATITRPDIAFSVNRLCQFMHNPLDTHWQALKRLLRYIKGTSSHGIFFSKDSPPTLHCFTDSDWGGDHDDRRSTNGFAIFLGKSLVSWIAKKQPTVSRSSTESEYKAIANATSELIWLRGLLSELQISISSATLHCDNLGAIYLSANPVFHARTKHIELDYHFVCEQVQSGFLQV